MASKHLLVRLALSEITPPGLHGLLHTRNILAARSGSRSGEVHIVADTLPGVRTRLDLCVLFLFLLLHRKIVCTTLRNLLLPFSVPLLQLAQCLLLPLLLLGSLVDSELINLLLSFALADFNLLHQQNFFLVEVLVQTTWCQRRRGEGRTFSH